MIQINQIPEWVQEMVDTYIPNPHRETTYIDITYAPLEKILEVAKLKQEVILVLNKSVTSINPRSYDVILYDHHYSHDLNTENYRFNALFDTLCINDEQNPSSIGIYLVLENIIDHSEKREILESLEDLLNRYK